MNTGIKGSDEALQAHNTVKEHKRDWVIFNKENEFKALYEAFAETEEPCYATLDYRFNTKDGRPTDKLVFIFYCHEDTKIRQRMKYAGTYESFSQKLDVTKKVQATELPEVEYDATP